MQKCNPYDNFDLNKLFIIFLFAEIIGNFIVKAWKLVGIQLVLGLDILCDVGGFWMGGVFALGLGSLDGVVNVGV